MTGSNWPTHTLREQAIAAVRMQKGLEKIPADAHEYGYVPGMSIVEFYAELLGALAKFESNYKPSAKYKEGFPDKDGNPVISRGLLQLSIESVRGYGFKLRTAEALHDPEINLRAGALIMSRWIVRDGVIAGGSVRAWRGMARYWSPFRKPVRVAAMKAAMKKVVSR